MIFLKKSLYNKKAPFKTKAQHYKSNIELKINGYQ